MAGSGIATMSDSSIALKPVIDEPSKPMPSSSAPSSSLLVIEKLFRCPSRSVNQSSMSSMPRASTSLEHGLPRLRVRRCAVLALDLRHCSFLPGKCDQPGKATNLLDVRILVTGGAGFIGSHFVKRLLRAGEDVVVLDKLTYSGNRANLPDGVELQQGDIAEPDDVARAARGCDAIVNFAAETHVDRSILSAEEFGRTEFRGTQVLLEHLRESRAAARPGLDGRGVRRPRVRRLLARDRRAAAVEPVQRRQGGRRPAHLCLRAHLRVNASITRGSNTYGPNQYPEKFIPLFVTNALDGEALPLYGDGRQVRDWLYVEDHCAGIELVLRDGRARRGLQRRRRRRAREPRGGAAADRADRRRSLAPAQGRGPARPRPPLLARHRRSSSRSAGGRRRDSRTGWRRRSSGTARTARGGSRSSPAATASTTSASTACAWPRRAPSRNPPSGGEIP